MLTDNKNIAIVLAGGKGTRMKSKSPKALHMINGVPLVIPILKTLCALEMPTIVVVGHEAENVKRVINDTVPNNDIHFATQKIQRGTGHAVTTALEHWNKPAQTMYVFNADDSFLYTPDFVKNFMQFHETNGKAVSIMTVPDEGDAKTLGRLMRDKEEIITGVTEDMPLPKGQTANEIVIGGYAINIAWFKQLNLFKNPKSGEYPLTGNIITEGIKQNQLACLRHENSDHWYSVNTPDDLKQLEHKLRHLKK